MRVLCVAEKPSISKAVTEILSGGQFNTRPGLEVYIKNYDFSYRWRGQGHTQFTMTAVAGHLTSSDFPKEFKGWDSATALSLFEAPINTFVSESSERKARNLKQEIRTADELMIWTDCDREGEYIGSEIATVCRTVKPNIRVTRARFSSLIAAQIHTACRNPVQLDLRQAAAVQARIEFDLRTGAAMTRLQCTALHTRIPELKENMISYGSCQYPTLGFVVDQYERLQHFKSEPFWYIHMSLERDRQQVNFTWARGHLFDDYIAFLLYEACVAQPEATVTKVQTKPTSKWKPKPLTTVELQKSGSRLLHLAPKTILDISEKLYQKGFLSYPRTETDQYDKDFNFMELIEKQTSDTAWGAFATQLKDGAFERPRNGTKNDQAHPPIHPTAHVSNLTGDDKRVYEYITRRFLASCSTNATGRETTIEADIAGEGFKTSGLVVLQRNYLEVFPYDKWTGSVVPDFQVGERFMPSVCERREGRTTAPKLLTEADLVNIMDKNGIGTDATIAEHINKILERDYVHKTREGRIEYLVPSTLGIGLVEGYNSMGLVKSLTKPHLRRETEMKMAQICHGTKSKREFLDETLEEYKAVFMTTRTQMGQIINAVAKYIRGEDGQDGAAPSDNDDNDGGPGSDDGHDDDDVPPARGPPRDRDRGRGRGRGGAARGRPAGDAPTRSTKGKAPARRPPQPKKDESDDDDDSPPPSCDCRLPAIRLTVKKPDSPHIGRAFFKCSKDRDSGQCQYFQWADEAQTAGQSRKRPLAEQDRNDPTRNTRARIESPVSQNDGPIRCACKLVASKNVSQKDGRIYYKCSKVSEKTQCKFWQWGDNEASQPAPPDAGGQSNFTCFKCGQPGHFSNACTNAAVDNDRNTGGRKPSYRGRGTTKRGRGSTRGASRGRRGRTKTF